MTQQRVFCSLVFILGFGKTMAKNSIIKWNNEPKLDETQNETPAAKKRREKRQISLEKKCITRRDGKKSKNKEAKESQRECKDCKYYELCVQLS